MSHSIVFLVLQFVFERLNKYGHMQDLSDPVYQHGYLLTAVTKYLARMYSEKEGDQRPEDQLEGPSLERVCLWLRA